MGPHPLNDSTYGQVTTANLPILVIITIVSIIISDILIIRTMENKIQITSSNIESLVVEKG
ncbi:uncharacterized protein P174DRAFT_438666 [Aspergillus novofumigatus IBT 16806]|uniref:Uncharacterized protein n=1 Tax=Aspergillus novofumigatus (strain IBT 16806) TaxID=1392255 RepID=A0A2I1CGT5_ASPN1|nr:uncharacterized protein P174DRAFT_438666 [Aspergillus novofumigatus IBT 16806]PKX96842.1 hypothetical protein P174DRAFT_438666 [Aspergillus novofumigatus IBT 16806]